jgi:NADH:ubiquinone reductase (H+-translocating)
VSATKDTSEAAKAAAGLADDVLDSRGRPARPHRVVIAGGGFAGLFAARALRDDRFAVTVIDRTEHHLFQPLLYQVATGILSEGQITAPLRQMFTRHRNLDSVMAEVIGIDPEARRVTCRRPMGQQVEFDYDSLIVAVGVEQSYFGHDEFSEWAPGMKTISDALTIRRRVFGAFEMADSATDPADRQLQLTFALVGAGPTGVELAGQIRELATKTLRAEFRHIEPQDARVLLFDGGDAPLAAFGAALSERATRSLGRLGVELHMGSIVTGVDGQGLTVRNRDGSQARYQAGTVLWTAGVAAPPLAQTLAKATGAQQDRAGRIVVDDHLNVPGHPDIFVVGDMMSLRQLPGVAEVAMQSGRYAGRRISYQVTGRGAARRFRYYDLGSAAYISRGDAVVSAGPVRLNGLAGWLSWLFIHIAFLTGYRNRAGAVLSWCFAFTRDARRERSFTSRQIGGAEDIYEVVATGSGNSPASSAR